MEYKLILVGASLVGKSSLVNMFVRNVFLNECDYVPTLEDSYRMIVSVEGENCLLDIVDTSGDPGLYPVVENQVRKGDGFLCVFALDDMYSFEQVVHFINKIRLVKDDPPILLVGNKCDKNEWKVDSTVAKACAESYNIPYIETSSKDHININQSFLSITSFRLKKLNNIENNANIRHCCTIC